MATVVATIHDHTWCQTVNKFGFQSNVRSFWFETLALSQLHHQPNNTIHTITL